MKRSIERENIERFVVFVLVARAGRDFNDDVDFLGCAFARRQQKTILSYIESHPARLPRNVARPLRLTVLAKPGKKVPEIGRSGGILIVAVRERAVDGRANLAILRALAEWLDVPVSQFSLVRGAASRSKQIDVAGIDPARMARKIAELTER